MNQSQVILTLTLIIRETPNTNPLIRPKKNGHPKNDICHREVPEQDPPTTSLPDSPMWTES